MDKYYWTEENFERLKTASAFPDLRTIAMDILMRMPQPISMVCGPISTGGLGNVRDNMQVFEKTIRNLHGSGKNVFNQLPFDRKFEEFSSSAHMAYFTPILDEFYLPLIKSGYIKEMNFIKDWQSSTGARWEHTLAIELEVAIVELQHFDFSTVLVIVTKVFDTST